MLDLILSWAAEIFADTLNFVITLILPVFGFTFDSFARAFPFAATAYGIFQRVALAIVMIITAWHLVPFLMSWFGIRTNELKSSPLRQLFQAVLAVIMIYYGNYLLNAIIDIAQYPFNALLYANNDPSWSLLQFDMSIVTGALSDLFFQTSILLYLILLLMIGFNLIKVLLEAVERYVVLFMLIYLSPLAASSLASEETSGIYKRFFVMFLSQCLLLLLNVWTIKMSISMFSNLGAHNVPALGLLMGYAFLRIALRMDSYLNQLGLNAAVTGAGLGLELMAAGSAVLGGFRGLTGGFAGGGAGGMSNSSSSVLGLRDKIAGNFSKWNLGAATGENAHAIGRGVVSGVRNYGFHNSADVAGKAMNAAKEAKDAGGSWSDMRHAAGDVLEKSGLSGSIGSSISYELEGVDNVYNNATRRTQNADAVAAFSAVEASENADADQNSTAYNAHQRLVSHNPHSAANVMAKFEANGYKTAESKNVSAVLEGIGARNASPALKKFIEVGNGTDRSVKGTPFFEMNKDGITASYVKNGTTETLELRNMSQYQALNKNEQMTYQQFSSKNGDTYYYRTQSTKGKTIVRPPSESSTDTSPGTARSGDKPGQSKSGGGSNSRNKKSGDKKGPGK